MIGYCDPGGSHWWPPGRDEQTTTCQCGAHTLATLKLECAKPASDSAFPLPRSQDVPQSAPSPVCPSCGHCPTCGRGSQYPVYPQWPGPYYVSMTTAQNMWGVRAAIPDV